jgi:hypothetical protein
MYRPDQLPGRASVLSGELQAGGNSLNLCLCSYAPPPPEGHPVRHAYTFVICNVRLAPKFQNSLPAVTLGTIYLCGCEQLTR